MKKNKQTIKLNEFTNGIRPSARVGHSRFNMEDLAYEIRDILEKLEKNGETLNNLIAQTLPWMDFDKMGEAIQTLGVETRDRASQLLSHYDPDDYAEKYDPEPDDYNIKENKSNSNMKQTIKLNESQLRKMIKESIKKVLNEVSWQTAAKVRDKRFDTVDKLRNLRGTRDLTQPELDLYKKSRISGNRDSGIAIEKLVDSILPKYPNLEIKEKYQAIPDDKGRRNTTCISVKDKSSDQFWVDVNGAGDAPIELLTRDNYGDMRRCNVPQAEYVKKNLPELYHFYGEIRNAVGEWRENMGLDPSIKPWTPYTSY